MYSSCGISVRHEDAQLFDPGSHPFEQEQADHNPSLWPTRTTSKTQLCDLFSQNQAHLPHSNKPEDSKREKVKNPQATLLRLQEYQQQLMREQQLQHLSKFKSKIMIQDRYRKSKNPFYKYFKSEGKATIQPSAQTSLNSSIERSADIANTPIGELNQSKAAANAEGIISHGECIQETPQTLVRNEPPSIPVLVDAEEPAHEDPPIISAQFRLQQKDMDSTMLAIRTMELNSINHARKLPKTSK